MRKYTVTVEVVDEEEGDKSSITMRGKHLGFLFGYVVRALEPFMGDKEMTDVIGDALEALPKDHPAHKVVKFTNRAVVGNV